MQRWITYAALLVVARAPQPFAAATVAPNDNRSSAGILERGVLNVTLEARFGLWYPEGEGGPALRVAAFAEEGDELTTPGPLIRVTEGTTVRATLLNRLDQPLVVLGFGKVRGLADSVIVPADGQSVVSFTATVPGTYYYTAHRAPDALGGRSADDSQLNGVIIVDPPNATPDPNERTLAMSWWCKIDPWSQDGIERCTMAINGLSWPHTEHLTYAQNDSVRWRVINFTESDHPMHLHGFDFRVDAKGDGVVDSVYAPTRGRLGDTEVMTPFQTMSLAWKAARPGNWIYHCHYASDPAELGSLNTDSDSTDSTMVDHHSADQPQQMYGLVIGISVVPNSPPLTPTERNGEFPIVQR